MFELAFEVRQHELAPAEQILYEGGAVSITLQEAGDEQIYEPLPGTMPLWATVMLSALFETDVDLASIRAVLEQALNRPVPVRATPVEERDWTRAWLDRFHPLRFGDNLWICPTGSSISEPGAVIIRLDPGLAFGTGTHATTALCLEWLARHDLVGAQAVDYGCGSGILSIAALKLGARQVTAVDIDPQALDATQSNAAKNDISTHDLTVTHPDRLKVEEADLILANILSNTLMDLYPAMASLTRIGGRIVLSGILSEQADDVAAVYSRGYRLTAPQTLDGWVLIEGQRV